MPPKLANSAHGDDVELLAWQELGIRCDDGPGLVEDVGMGNPTSGVMRHDLRRQDRPLVVLDMATGVDDLDERVACSAGAEANCESHRLPEERVQC